MEFEWINIMRIPFDETVKMVMEGKINANSTCHALLKVRLSL